jgi:hypothetical protein
MARRRHAPTLGLSTVTFTGPPQPRPDPFPSDEKLLNLLGLWSISLPLPPEVQQAVNFRLLDLLQEKHKPPTPMQRALAEVSLLVSGKPWEGWSATRACKEIARLRGLDADSLARAWRKSQIKKDKEALEDVIEVGLVPRTKTP